MSGTATVIIADDHPMIRTALRLGVERIDPSAQVVEVESLAALKVAIRCHPQTSLVLLDLMMPDVEGLASLQFLRREWPAVRVAVVSGQQQAAWVRSAEALGAVAFIPKSTPAAETQQILGSLLGGGEWWPAQPGTPAPTTVARESSLEARLNRLSRQELRILLHIKEGWLNKQIADDLDIRESTVKTHITAILRKLDLRSRTQAAVVAQRLLIGL
ncbi:MAG: response regulator transcription factor [Stagnimonas sp.]|nr:response regulator transcription factor [Stagnimonas sp.]